MKYLGVPLIAKKLGVNDCKILVNKVSEKINCWKNKVLSYAGRIQLIASVLSSMQIYWASVYMFPSSTINEIEKLLKGFLWCQGPLTSGKAKVAWKQVCLPKEQGGLGIKSLKKWNEVLLIKQLWKIIEGKESLREWYRERYNDKETVAQMINNGIWIWPMQWYSNYPILCKIAAPTLTEGTKDKVYWIDSYNVLATQDRIAKWNGQISTECPLCKKEKDSHEHFIMTSLSQTKVNKNIGKVIARIALAAAVYFIWQERNWRIFKQEDRSVELKIITDNIRLRLMSLKVKQTSTVIKVAEAWNLQVEDSYLRGTAD
ncbi:hypothetical protein Tco_0598307 [Tanacetum coccineum]